MSQEYDPISLEILWSQLIATVDQSAAALVRTSFSTSTRESNDYGCVLMDVNGDSLAENSSGIPSFVGVLPITTRHFLQRFPVSELRPGDVLMTNDPWLASGHLPDVTVVMPVFYKGKLVAFAGNIAHSADMGGAMWTPDARELFEEGLRIPPARLMIAGEPNEDLLELVRANVRTPDHTVGDFYAQAAAAQVCARRLCELMDEQGIDDLSPLARAIQAQAENAMRKAIRELPEGEYRYEMETDGYDKPLMFRVKIEIRDGEIHVDYTGTSPQVDRGLNAVMNFTRAYTVYPIKCLLAPHMPNNEGSRRPIHVYAPEGSLLNPRFPAAVNSRQLTGHFLPPLIMQAMAPAVADRVIADSGAGPTLRTVYTGIGYNEKPFSAVLFASGGMGATPIADGLSCISFPTNVSAGSIEALESVAPLMFWKKEMLPDSGGAGKYRGGLGQEVIVEVMTKEPIRLATHADRQAHPALGIFGGKPGSLSKIVRNEGGPVPPKGRSTLQPRDRLTIRFCGGGGYGSPLERDPALIEWDLKNGLISEQAAEELYQVSARRAATGPQGS